MTQAVKTAREIRADLARIVEGSLKGQRILLAEDEPLIAMYLKDELERVGATVVGPVAHLADGMRCYETASDIDAAILDVDLGKHDVFPLARRLVCDGVPMVFHTGRRDHRCLNGEFASTPVCPKPATIERLVFQVAGILRH